ncbi:hypothetical protein JXB28_00400 [Candidatus Woesearchaeota archaeon]|nr:hypothetical protein [Candidatus Woesearchaeota archaeon]
MKKESANPKSFHIHGYRIVFSNKGKTAKATRISVINKMYIDEQKFFSHMARLGFLLSRPRPNMKLPDCTLVFRKKK